MNHAGRMNRKQRRIQSRSKSNTRRTGVTYLAIAGLAGGSIGLATPSHATEALCNDLKVQLGAAVTSGGNVVANFSGTCDFAEGFIFREATTITGPTDGSLTLAFTGAGTFFQTSANLNVSNLNFTETRTPGGINYFIFATPITSPAVNPNITISNSTFSNAEVVAAIYSEGHIKVSDSSFTNLTMEYSAIESKITGNISNSTFTSLNTINDGSAIASYGELTVADSTFESNSAYSGGAILSRGPLAVTNSTFSGNSATQGNGGAILAYSVADVENSTFVNNSASNGAALSLSEGSIISNNTFWNNGDSDSGSIETDFTYFFGNIMANSSAAVDVIGNGYTNNIDLGANLYTDDSVAFATPTVGEGASKLVTFDDLELSALALNQTAPVNTGETKTVSTGTGSVARDYYSATSIGAQGGITRNHLAKTDQRGVARPFGAGYDVGAYEAGEDALPAVVVQPQAPVTVAKETIGKQRIAFAPGSSKLSAASKKKLRTLATEIQTKGLKTVNLEGYTATLTKAAPSGKVFRVKLSKARAVAVEKYLKQQFKKSGYAVTFTKSAKGAANRVKSNKFEKGRVENRRVEISIN